MIGYFDNTQLPSRCKSSAAGWYLDFQAERDGTMGVKFCAVLWVPGLQDLNLETVRV